MMFALVALGSRGDLDPLLALGRALREVGHDVVVLSHQAYAKTVTAEGLTFHSVVSQATHTSVLGHPRLWHPIDGFGVLWRHLCVPAALSVLSAISQLCNAHPSAPVTVIASPLSIGARLARDLLPVRLATVHLSPSSLRMLDDPCFVGPFRIPDFAPRPLRASAWDFIDWWKLEPLARAAIQKLRFEVGLPALSPDTRVFRDWLPSPDFGLALFGRELGVVEETALRPLSSHPPLLQAGFARFMPRARPHDWAELEAEFPLSLRDFLCRHPSPAVVYPGSAAPEGHALSAAFAERLARISRRGVVFIRPNLATTALSQSAVNPVSQVSAAKSLSSTLRSNDLLAIDHLATFPALLRHSGALLHHGGAGTIANACVLCTPQLFFPTAYDQFENARRVTDQIQPHLPISPSLARVAKLLSHSELSAFCNTPPAAGGPTEPPHLAGMSWRHAPNAAMLAARTALSQF